MNRNKNPNIDPAIIARARDNFAPVDPFPAEGRGHDAEGLVISPSAIRQAMGVHGQEGSSPARQPEVGYHPLGIKRVSIVDDRHNRIRGRR